MRFEESNFSSGQMDFVPRDRRNQTTRLATAFGLIVLALFLFAFIPGLAGTKAVHVLYGALILFTMALGFFVVRGNQQTLDIIMTTEFQNLLFSQALALGTSFCLFVRRDGTIVYANDGMRRLFGHGYGESQALETLFANGGVGKADRDRVMGAIYGAASERLVFPITGQNKEEKQYVLTVEPLPRPSGYVLVRGREFRGSRHGVQVMPDMLRTTSPDKLDHLLSYTPIAHYATDAFGRFEYVNQAFEQMLGYEQGEAIGTRLTLSSVLERLGERTISQDYTIGDFAGEAVVRGKTGTTSNCLIFQTVIRDENGRAIGASGSIIAANMMR